jgi:fumarate hydratase subunit alpha
VVDEDAIVDALVAGIRRAVIEIPPDVARAIEGCHRAEKEGLARMQLRIILDNIAMARKEGLPLCQDTGLMTFFVEAGHDFPHLATLCRAMPLALERATSEVPLRSNTVDPFTRTDPGNNLGHNMPLVTVDMVEGDGASVHILPKGGGSENASALWMLTPAEGLKGMRERVLRRVQEAGGRACPPLVLGIGIGGGADAAMRLAKKALLRPLDEPNPDGGIAALEKEMLDDVNALGIGPSGTGGKATALSVHIEYTCHHIASFAAGLSVQCWCDRRTVVKITREGRVI